MPNSKNCVFFLGCKYSVEPQYSTTDKHAKKCVLGVFLNCTRLALLYESQVIDIDLENAHH